MRGLHLRLSIAFCCLAAQACGVPVLKTDEQQANAAVLALGRAGIGAETKYTGEQVSVEVARTDVARALAALAAEHLPRTQAPGLAATFQTPSLVPTPTEETVRINQGLTADLQRTLLALPGVVAAHVHLALPAPETWDPNATPAAPSCSVMLQHHGREPLASTAIQQLIAGGVRGLDPARVTVVFRRLEEASATQALAQVGPFATTPSSAPLLRTTLAGLLLANLAFVAVALYFARAWRRASTNQHAATP